MSRTRSQAALEQLAGQVLAIKAEPAVQQAFQDARQAFFGQWVVEREPARREALWYELQGLIRVQEALQATLNRARKPIRER